MSTVTSIPALGNPVDGAIIARDDLPEALHKTRPASPGSSESIEEKAEKGGSTSEDDEIAAADEKHALASSSTRVEDSQTNRCCLPGLRQRRQALPR